MISERYVLVSAGRWRKLAYSHIHDDSRTGHKVPKLSERVFSVLVKNLWDLSTDERAREELSLLMLFRARRRKTKSNLCEIKLSIKL